MNTSSFWTLWFWIAHVVAWSMSSHFTLGVPYDMVIEANREREEGGPWSRAAEAMILAQVFRITSYSERFGAIMIGTVAFIISVLLTMAVMADSELSRAMLTIFVPLTLIYIFGARAARVIAEQDLRGTALRRRMRNQRLLNQLFGLLAIACAVGLAIWEALRDFAFWGVQ